MKFILVLLLMLLCLVHGYKHVVFMHGIFAGADEFDHFTDLVQQYHPGTPVTKVKMYENLESLVNLWKQVVDVEKTVAPILTNISSEGTILICFSQGGTICRGLLATLKHNVDTFISLSAPLAGQFGDTIFLKNLFPSFIKDNIYKLFYTVEGQVISIGNYWYDPHHYGLYQKYSQYLAVLNNESATVNNRSQEFHDNFLRLKNLVLVGGPDDGVITPWQSSQFAMYNSKEEILPMEKQKWYMNDAFGLRTLKKRGAIKLHSIPGVHHSGWHKEDKIFDCCVKPWLS